MEITRSLSPTALCDSAEFVSGGMVRLPGATNSIAKRIFEIKKKFRSTVFKLASRIKEMEYFIVHNLC